MLRSSWRGLPSDQHEDARFLWDLEDALHQVWRLKEVTQLLDSKFSREERLPWDSLKYHKPLTYDRHWPPGQESLSLGRPR